MSDKRVKYDEKNYRETDPEFAERLEHFLFEEVPEEEGQQLDETTRHMAIIATLLGCQGLEEFRLEISRALDAGLSPVMIKEVIYQAVDYLGIGRVRPFLDAANEILRERGVELPLEGQATTTMEDRLKKGVSGSGGYFRRRNERSLEERSHQPLAGGQLLRRLLHAHRPVPGTAGDDRTLLPVGSGRLRTAADSSRGRQYESGK